MRGLVIQQIFRYGFFFLTLQWCCVCVFFGVNSLKFLRKTVFLSRLVHENHCAATKKNKEWQEKLPIVVLKAEEIMYSKANSEVSPLLFSFSLSPLFFFFSHL